MALRLYNTLTKTKEDFVPLDPKNVRMYVCGPTVYDYAHIGNARPAIVFDVLYRLLRHVYGESHVTYVRNITDVDDKIIKAALEKNVSIEEITQRTARQYFDDVAALGCLTPTHQPRATEYVKQMIVMIERLIASGHAYAAEGHALYDVSSKPDYGKLARRSLDEMMAGARVEVAPYKKNPMDFVLWKPSDPSQPGWDSPWGRGRPGWHIECSAMSEALLCTPFNTDTFDIHGGGIDLVFPHHENEIAQSESAHHNHPFAKVWMHNGFLQVEGEKMSKSLGNFLTIHDLLKDWPGEVLRLNMLKRHYHQPIDWTGTGLEESRRLLIEWLLPLVDNAELVESARHSADRLVSQNLLNALSDDLNTHLALQEIHNLRNAVMHSMSSDPVTTLAASLAFMGLLPNDISKTLECLLPRPKSDEAEIKKMVDARNAARKAKDFKESDRIRDELLAKGIVLKDGPNGTTWEVKR